MKEYLQSIGLKDEEVERAVKKFDKYREMLVEWNNKFNLTSITDKAEVELKHFIDSLAGLSFINGSVLDVGSGAGFPSLPLAIIRQDCKFTLADATGKKITFLNEVIQELELTNARTIHIRAEDLPKDEYYDCVVARAVAPLNVLAEYCIPFLKIGGEFIAYKAYDIDEELNASKTAIHILGAKTDKVVEVPLFESEIIRKLVIIKKISKTKPIYPRSGNKPKLAPL